MVDFSDCCLEPMTVAAASSRAGRLGVLQAQKKAEH